MMASSPEKQTCPGTCEACYKKWVDDGGPGGWPVDCEHATPAEPSASEPNNNQGERSMKYRKKPVVVEAFKWTEDKVPSWWEALEGVQVNTATMSAFIPMLEGTMEARRGDYIIQGVQGEIYPCKPDIFEATYEPAE